MVARFKWHPARTFSLGTSETLHARSTGVMDGRIVNIVDDAPTTAYEIASLVGLPIEPSAEPLTNPWMGPVPRRVENESGLGSGD